MIKATILGCGSSGGVPRIGGIWGACNPDQPRNRRRRCALLIEQGEADAMTRVLIDTGPDFVPQMLDAGIGALDAVVYTHAHADHIHGIDDLRQVAQNMGRMIPVWADALTANALQTRFGYIFQSPAGSSYPPICLMNLIEGAINIDGPGGTVTLQPIPVDHGGQPALGFRVTTSAGGLVYLPDVLSIPDSSWPLVEDAQVFICDGLRHTPHPSHAHLALAVEWIVAARAQRGIITNMHIDLDYDAVQAGTPAHIDAAYDGMVIEIT